MGTERKEGWGSAEATEMVLNNIFYITAKVKFLVLLVYWQRISNFVKNSCFLQLPYHIFSIYSLQIIPKIFHFVSVWG